MAKKKITAFQRLIAKRRVARKLAMMGIYQWQINQNTFDEIYLHFEQDEMLGIDFRKSEPTYFYRLLHCAIQNTTTVDTYISPVLDRDLRHVDMIELAILRMATCELLHSSDVPYKIIINESVNLTKKFGAEKAHRFVNGVLDKIAAKIRVAEFDVPH